MQAMQVVQVLQVMQVMQVIQVIVVIDGSLCVLQLVRGRVELSGCGLYQDAVPELLECERGKNLP